MGSCISTADQLPQEKFSASDKHPEEDRKRLKQECKILLLGSGESGKTTFVKQMKIIYQGGFSPTELAEYRPVVYTNVLDSAQRVIIYMKKIGLGYMEYSNRDLAEIVLEYRLDTHSSNPYFPTEIAEAIHRLWKDPATRKTMDEHSSDFYLMDSAAYFFSEVLRIGSPGYLPNDTDVLCARQKGVDVAETKFTMGGLAIHIFDVGGQRSQRKKWIHCFESVTSLIFCAALSEYDQVLLEEETQNRMLESLELFESVINSRWFIRTSVILFLNKIDVFKEKLTKVPLGLYFPEYSGGSDINKAAKYILFKFIQANRARLTVYPHLTQATDTTIIRLVLVVVQETILKNALKNSGIL